MSEEYKAGAQFGGGIIETVVIDIAGERHTGPEAEARFPCRGSSASLSFYEGG